MSTIEVKIFVSSPGDTEFERNMARSVMQRLNIRYEGQARFYPTFWEDGWYSAHETFQNQIPEATQFDLVLAIFKHRLGTPLPEAFPKKIPGFERPFPSGTAYEVLSAIFARRSGQRLPDILIYRRPESEGPRLEGDAAAKEEIFRQYKALQTFFEENLRSAEGEFQGSYKSYRQVDDLQSMLESDLSRWLADRRGVHERKRTWNLQANGSPFPGLHAYDAHRNQIFFGREHLIERALRELRGGFAAVPADEQPERRRFLLLLGASGSGKSSLLHAGLVPKLVSSAAIVGVEEWRLVQLTAGSGLFAALAEQLLQPDCLHDGLAAAHLDEADALQRHLQGDSETAWRPLRAALDRIAEQRRVEKGLNKPPQVELLLVLDQIERSFNEAGLEERTAFFNLIQRCVQEQLVTVLGALRSDAYDGLQQVPALLALRDAGITLDVVPLKLDELEEMLLETAAACEPPLQFENCGDAVHGPMNLARTLVNDASGGDALPMLQITLEQLYQEQKQRNDHRLACADYHGLEAAVTQSADAALKGLAETERGALKALVLNLIDDVSRDATSGEWRPRIKPLPRASFERGHPVAASLIDALIGARLLVAEKGEHGAQVRPTHEALLRIWPQAKAVVEDAGELIRIRKTIEPMVRAWQDAPEAEKVRYLELAPALLDGAQQLVNHFGEDVDQAMRDYIAQAGARDAAVRDRERQMQAQRIRDAEAVAAANRKRFFWATGFAMALLVTTLIVVVSYNTLNEDRNILGVDIGLMYAGAQPTKSDVNTALHYLFESAKEGHKRAQFVIGSLYYFGRHGINKNYTRAAYWYQKSANHGYAQAEFSLGNAYRLGKGVPKNSNQAAFWFQKAANQGLANAEFNMGFCYYYGEGITQNLNQAVYWYQKAANQGYVRAEFNLGFMYLHGQGVRINLNQAAYWYQKAADQGNPLAEFALSALYFSGQGLQHDFNLAAYWCQKAADQGYAIAEFALGNDYFHGIGVQQSFNQSAFWYQRAADQGYAAAEYALGNLYYNSGLGVRHSFNRAAYWCRKAAHHGFAPAEYALSKLYQNGQGVRKDTAKAAHWARQAAKQ